MENNLARKGLNACRQGAKNGSMFGFIAARVIKTGFPDAV